jgi:hypothetical protein
MTEAYIIKKTDNTYRVILREQGDDPRVGLRLRDAVDYTGDRVVGLCLAQTIEAFEAEITAEREEVRAWVEKAGDVENLKRIAERAVRNYRAKRDASALRQIADEPDPRD